MYVCMKWSYCERERERERIGDVQKMLVVLSVSSFVNIEKLPKENILRRREGDTISSGRDFCVSLEVLAETEC